MLLFEINLNQLFKLAEELSHLYVDYNAQFFAWERGFDNNFLEVKQEIKEKECGFDRFYDSLIKNYGSEFQNFISNVLAAIKKSLSMMSEADRDDYTSVIKVVTGKRVDVNKYWVYYMFLGFAKANGFL